MPSELMVRICSFVAFGFQRFFPVTDRFYVQFIRFIQTALVNTYISEDVERMPWAVR